MYYNIQFNVNFLSISRYPEYFVVVVVVGILACHYILIRHLLLRIFCLSLGVFSVHRFYLSTALKPDVYSNHLCMFGFEFSLVRCFFVTQFRMRKNATAKKMKSREKKEATYSKHCPAPIHVHKYV